MASGVDAPTHRNDQTPQIAAHHAPIPYPGVARGSAPKGLAAQVGRAPPQDAAAPPARLCLGAAGSGPGTCERFHEDLHVLARPGEWRVAEQLSSRIPPAGEVEHVGQVK